MPVVAKLLMITPFGADVADLAEAQQLLLLKGCVLCQITRDLDHDSVRTKPEWRSCKEELGTPVEVVTIDRVPPEIVQLIGQPPSVCAVLPDGSVVPLLDEAALARCRGSVSDFRGRLLYRLAAAGLTLGARA